MYNENQSQISYYPILENSEYKVFASRTNKNIFLHYNCTQGTIALIWKKIIG